MSASYHRPGWWHSRQYAESDSDADYRIPINRTGLTPWHWGGLRGEMVTIALISCFVLLVYVRWWEAAIVVPLLILLVAKKLHMWHPYWVELLVRLMITPAGFQDS